MQKKDFEQFLRDFHNYAKCITEKPVLLLLDNHNLHLNIEGINYAKQNRIVMLFFPPYCSHQLRLE